MSVTNAATSKPKLLHHHHHKDKPSATPTEFKADAVVEGKFPIKPQDEVDIQSAREVFDMRSRKNMGKSYKVKVIGTDTRLIIKRKSVVSSSPREISLLCNEVYRFFIFTRDPKLVILVIPDLPEGNRAYLLLKMKSQADANSVCNVIQSGRKKLSSQSALQQETVKSPSQSRASESFQPDGAEVEMQENGKSLDKPGAYDSESSHSENGHADSDTGTISTPKNSKHTGIPEASSRRAFEGVEETKIKGEPIQLASIHDVQSAFPGMAENENSTNSVSKSDSNMEEGVPRSLPRTPLHSSPVDNVVKERKEKKEKRSPHRREPPLTEEMYVEPPKNWKVAQPICARREEDLKKALLVDMYDDDWAVDVKLIKSDGSFGSRISDTGNVYMFTAHHLVPENYSYFDCSSSSDEEIELKEKPMKMSNGIMRHRSSSSESEHRNGYAGVNRY
ncbi:unnamed protein product [Rodentolepis nana]|uniref:PID domain-containing protein n=1 Tax=Rodentolepis nana TaxID=102285 RepID=A0A0R3TW89_RODNA|nr:unnamed protein product [Rodentolepis nana]